MNYVIHYYPIYSPTVKHTATIETMHAAYDCARALRKTSAKVVLYNPDGAVLLEWANPDKPPPITLVRFADVPLGYEAAYVPAV